MFHLQRMLNDYLPPINPVLTGTDEDWIKMSEKSIQLPSDYCEFVKTCGYCSIGLLIQITNPFVPSKWSNVFDVREELPAILAEHPFNTPTTVKFKKEIAERRLFPCIITTNGDYFFWIASDLQHPETWQLAYSEVNFTACDVFCKDIKFVELLWGLLKHAIVPLDNDQFSLSPKEHRFEPIPYDMYQNT